MIAVKRLQSLFWVLLVAFGALGAYLVSLRVATERNELMRVRTEIAQARADIRYLETELAARSSIRQLEKWNADDFRYSPRASGQYLDGERALASLDGVEPNGPAYVAPPVMVAMMDNGSDAAPKEVVASPAALQIRSDAATIRAASAAPATLKQENARVNLAAVSHDPAPTKRSGSAMETGKAATGADSRKADVKKSAGKKEQGDEAHKKRAETSPSRSANAVARKTERMAMLDDRLLDDRTLGDLGRKAAAENRAGKSRGAN